ncbi:winged helix family two component transcriptional regulator [Actinocorallia herbida]|uniref:Winged helix family two component transcriptional regulator n=1 Tax=Actinocorallia herbida TaxID=58109 RepID=A0A3N1D203_9ACTN|nr:response regulator transcription factor [Actinocorallia herbida]ROO87564.1 winged helix family two component transcriptional regulator [Actinocorallia herbida]
MAFIVVCEDDAAVRDLLKRVLEHDGHTVSVTGTADRLLRNLEPVPDLVVLDLGLPDADGRDVCVALRACGVDAPVLMLTALDGMHHKVGGFEAGADDYVTKPFDVPELLVRVRALLRRTTAVTSPSGVVLDPAKHVVTCGSRSESLTPTEFRLLGRLIAARGEAVRRHALVAAGWPHGAQVSDNTLDSFVRRLRTKLGVLGAADHLVTVRGVGYRWR